MENFAPSNLHLTLASFVRNPCFDQCDLLPALSFPTFPINGMWNLNEEFGRRWRRLQKENGRERRDLQECICIDEVRRIDVETSVRRVVKLGILIVDLPLADRDRDLAVFLQAHQFVVECQAMVLLKGVTLISHCNITSGK